MLAFLLGFCYSLKLNFIPSTKTPPSSRGNLYIGYLESRSSIILFGGLEDSILRNDIWEFSLNSMIWQEIVPLSSEVPSMFYLEPRKNFAGLTSSFKPKLYIFGGQTIGGSENDLWEFDFDKQKWEIKQTLNSPSPREDFGFVSMVEDHHELLVIQGGMVIAGSVNEMWRLNLTSFEWTLMEDAGDAPVPSSLPVLLYYEGSLIQTAGYANPDYCLSCVYKYSLSDRKWEIISDKNSKITYRYLCQGFIHNHQLFILYGWNYIDDDVAQDTIIFDLKSESKTWQETNLFQELASSDYALVKVKNYVYHFGGYNFLLRKTTNIFSKIDLITFKVNQTHNFQIFPKQRAHHSLVLINQKLFLFGGVHNDNIFNDLWTFDLDAYIWSQISAKGSIPTPRYLHAYAVEGNTLVVWGGKDKSGLKNDMFIFNALTETWTELISSSSNPRPAKGACLVLKNLSIYLFGGRTDSDISNELWQYRLGNNSFELLSDSDIYSVVFHKCWIDNNIFYSALGDFDNGGPAGTIKAFNFSSSTWSSFHDHGHNKWDSSQSLQIVVDNKLISIGGFSWGYFPIFKILVLEPGSKLEVYDLDIDFAIFGSASVYYKKNLVVFGGSLKLGPSLLSNVGHNLLFYLKLEEICEKVNCEAFCSAGTIANGKDCKQCPAGSFNEIPASMKCIECKPGSFNQNKSSSSSQQCVPCPEGRYNDKYGANACQVCPSDKNCPVGSFSYSELQNIENKRSIQPPLYEETDLTKSIIIYQTSVSVPLFLVMIVLFSFRKLRVWAKKLDFFDDKHDNPDSEFMVRKKTLIGACFSFLFIIGVLLMTCSSILTYFRANVHETKGLVTLSVLEADVGSFEADNFLVQFLLFSYGGECGNKLKESISIISKNINYTQKVLDHEILGNNSCKIRISFKKAIINSGALIMFTLNENPSYSSGIEVSLISNSSIPDQISSVLTNVKSVTNSVFIGPYPSEFYFLATPSLFLSESNQWKEKETGYHISERSSPKAGSMFKSEELSSVSFLNIKVYIEKSPTGLLTQRKLKQSFFFFVGNLLGSATGLFGIGGFFMALFESRIQILLKRVRKNEIQIQNISDDSIPTKAANVDSTNDENLVKVKK